MAIKFRQKILLFKIESVYGTDAVPSGAANAIQTRNLEITPLEGQLVGIDVDGPNIGNSLQLLVGNHVRFQFEVMLAGAGAAGTAPAYGVLLRACGMAETIDAGVDVQYAPQTGSEPSGTGYLYFGGERHRVLGCRGTFGMRLSALGLPVYTFDFTGLYTGPTTDSDPTPDLSAFVTPVEMNTANTAVTLHGQAVNTSEWTLNQGNEVIYRNLTEQESVEIVDRAPGGNLAFERLPQSTFDVFAAALNSTEAAFQVVHGTSAGNIVQFDATKTQILRPRDANSDGVRMTNVDLAHNWTSGDDDFLITIK